MPLIRCQKCEQAYDVPPAVAVRLPYSIARCSCGELVYGSKETLASRFASIGDIEEVDLSRWRTTSTSAPPTPAVSDQPDSGKPRSIRLIGRGAEAAINQVFTILNHPLWIGRKGCHVQLADAELSIRHCQIVRRGEELWLRDSDSHTGTFLDGEPVVEERIGDGVHLIRVGQALLCVEPVEEPGTAVGEVELESKDLFNVTPELMRKLQEKRSVAPAAPRRSFLLCVEGPLAGREFEIPAAGLIVGREGNVRVPDEYLSRKHFAVTRDEEGNIRIRDLGSRNGTFLNTLPARNTRVHPGDEIRAGLNLFRVVERS
jgi:pSer/pThr/pTyr-binding forkhead associated (FHA) protein